MTRTPLAAVSAALLAVSGGVAQQVCATGLVEKAPPFSICVSRASHFVRCANLRLISNTVRLDQHTGKIVELCGTVRTLGNCRTMTVSSVRTNVEQLTITGLTNGTVKLGAAISLDLSGAPNRAWGLLFAGNRGWTPTPIGQLLLAAPFTFLTSGFLSNQGKSSVPFRIPNDPSLVNANAFFQAGFVDVVQQTAALRNSACFRVTR